MTEWLVATRSRGKLAELVPILATAGIVAVTPDAAGLAVSPDEELIEVFDTFEENALAKARYFARRTGRPCLAEDSGLRIDALDGEPGVRSRRFARDRGVARDTSMPEDAANNEAMIEACWDSGRAPPWRAHFVCAAALVDGVFEVVASGRCDGAIHVEPSGNGGFGYDPYFVSDELGVAFADASREQKSAVSHRAGAIRSLLHELRTASIDRSAR